MQLPVYSLNKNQTEAFWTASAILGVSWAMTRDTILDTSNPPEDDVVVVEIPTLFWFWPNPLLVRATVLLSKAPDWEENPLENEENDWSLETSLDRKFELWIITRTIRRTNKDPQHLRGSLRGPATSNCWLDSSSNLRLDGEEDLLQEVGTQEGGGGWGDGVGVLLVAWEVGGR